MHGKGAESTIALFGLKTAIGGESDPRATFLFHACFIIAEFRQNRRQHNRQLKKYFFLLIQRVEY